MPIHVVEEWVFPGGFHYQYNTLMHSDRLDRYPMCRLSDMITNLGVTALFMGMTVVFAVLKSVPAGVVVAALIFSLFEVISHSLAGYKMYKQFQSKGKTTIYGPGSVTAYWGFGVLAVLSVQCLLTMDVTWLSWVIGVAMLAGGVILFIVIPENAIKSMESPYYFESAGYYERFL